MCVRLCIPASSRILRHDPGDKPILSDGGVTTRSVCRARRGPWQAAVSDRLMGPGRSHPPVHHFGRAAVSPISTVAFVNFIQIYFELIQIILKSSKIHRNLNKFRKNKKSHLLVEFKGFLGNKSIKDNYFISDLIYLRSVDSQD
jgi:hypothetical protein